MNGSSPESQTQFAAVHVLFISPDFLCEAGATFRQIVATIVDEAVPPVEMAGCSARMLDAVAAALDEYDASA